MMKTDWKRGHATFDMWSGELSEEVTVAIHLWSHIMCCGQWERFLYWQQELGTLFLTLGSTHSWKTLDIFLVIILSFVSIAVMWVTGDIYIYQYYQCGNIATLRFLWKFNDRIDLNALPDMHRRYLTSDLHCVIEKYGGISFVYVFFSQTWA